MAKQKKKKKKSKGIMRLQFILKLLLFLLLLSILILGILLYLRYGKTVMTLHDEANQLVRQSDVNTFRQSETSEVYDVNGKLIATLKGEKDTYYLTYEQIPDSVKQAMISIEDKRFLKHHGIDLKGILRAAKAYIVNKGEITQGASTITQQLSRNIFLTHEVSWQRKVKEIFIALAMEKKYTKDQIMEFYLNNIYFGNGYYGIEAASKGYFSSDVDDLSLAQIAFLCAIPNNPSLYDPIEHSDNTVKRKNRILLQMKLDGALDEVEYQTACAEEITLKETKTKKRNYIETYVYYCAVRALMKNQGFNFRYTFGTEEEKERYDKRYDEMYSLCQQSLYSAGYRIYTSIDTKKQKLLQNAVNETLKEFTSTNTEGVYELQSAATCIDNKSGRVVAIVGGRSQNTQGYTLNRAFQSFRQPGSSIKPLIVYTPSFERNYTPDSIVVDKKFEGGPSNSSGTYAGKITVRTAVERSINTIAWQMFTELTPQVGLQYLLNMNFAKISENDYYPAASLGGFTNGVSSVEMASGFAALENEGVFREPTCIVSILDAKGNEVVGDIQDTKVIYEANAARMMTDVMTGVFIRGTAKGLSLSGMSCAGKTGTTTDKKDGWFVGYTPYYTTSVWVGYDIPKKLDSLAGATYPGSIWKMYMQQIHEGLTDTGFAGYTKPVEETEGADEQTKEQETTKEPDTMASPNPEDENIFDLDAPLEGEEDETSDQEEGTQDTEDEPDTTADEQDEEAIDESQDTNEEQPEASINPTTQEENPEDTAADEQVQ
ncbi:MAG: penicillin-binding protein [Clostridiales bacterium]|nr:penicillin-binding protein [Clostridiales bacterium]